MKYKEKDIFMLMYDDVFSSVPNASADVHV